MKTSSEVWTFWRSENGTETAVALKGSSDEAKLAEDGLEMVREFLALGEEDALRYLKGVVDLAAELASLWYSASKQSPKRAAEVEEQVTLSKDVWNILWGCIDSEFFRELLLASDLGRDEVAAVLDLMDKVPGGAGPSRQYRCECGVYWWQKGRSSCARCPKCSSIGVELER